MKFIIIVVGSLFGITGCQVSTTPPLSETLSTLSNEDLCRALGTYNHNGALVLKIYDELKKRPGKIDTERCYILEKKDREPNARPWTINAFPQQTLSHYHKPLTMQKDGKNHDIPSEIFSVPPLWEDIRTLSTKKGEQGDTSIFSTKTELTKGEKKLEEILRVSLQKHLSHSYIHTNK